MIMILLRYVVILLLIGLEACGGGGSSSSTTPASEECSSPISQHSYLMAFHMCNQNTTTCSDPANHMIYLASSDDGLAWSLITEFTPRSGSVPDLVAYQNYLYVFHTGNSENWVKLNACMEAVDSGATTITGGTDTAGFVDPSLIVSGSQLSLFYLPGILGSDPAGCSTYPCTKEIHSAITSSTSPTSFTQQAGVRSQEILNTGAYSDPDIIALNNGSYLLNVSNGQSVIAYTATSLDTEFSSPAAPSQTLVSNNSGGVPTAIQVTSGDVWLYVTRNQAGKEDIRRGVSSDGISMISDVSFTTVIDATMFGSASDPINVSSPSIINWDDLANWSR
jgi:hypothetical protein